MLYKLQAQAGVLRRVACGDWGQRTASAQQSVARHRAQGIKSEKLLGERQRKHRCWKHGALGGQLVDAVVLGTQAAFLLLLGGLEGF